MPRRGLPELPELSEQIVRTPQEFADCLQYLSTVDLLGFDTEFVGENTYRPDLGLIQLSTVDRLIIIDPLGLKNLEQFWQLLLDPKRTTLVHSGREDVRMCWYTTGQPPSQVVDVQIAAGLVGMTYPISYAGLVQELLQVKMHKSETLTDWLRRPLTANQLSYAFDDVRYLIPAWKVLRGTLSKLNRLDWATEEFATFVQRSIAEEGQVERWRKLKGIGGLSRKELAIVRELFNWRDRRAAQWNRPQRIVLRDELITEMAKRPPRKLDEVSQLRGVAKSEADAIFEAVSKALSLPPSQWPDAPERESDAPQLGTISGLLQIVLTEWANQHRVAPNLIASLSDLKSLIRVCQAGTEISSGSALGRGWRATAVLPYLRDFLHGHFALRLNDLRSSKPIKLVPMTAPDSKPEEEV
jgi:ribonuclease D